MSRGGRFDTLEPERFELADVFMRVSLANLVSKGATCARGGVLKFIHVFNKDTLYIPAHLLAEHSLDHVWCLFFSSVVAHTP